MSYLDLSSRSTQIELMDAEEVSFAEFHHCLTTLEKINFLTMAYRPVVKWMKSLSDSPLTILDAGSGGGGMLRRLARLPRSFSMIGVDLNPWSKKSADLLGVENTKISYQTADIFSYSANDNIDVIISSHFTHHLTNEQIIQFIRWMDQTAKQGWFINDLHRHWLPYYFIDYAVKLFCSNRLTRYDAAISVARSFTRRDWQALLQLSGIAEENVEIRWFFPFHYCVSCKK